MSQTGWVRTVESNSLISPLREARAHTDRLFEIIRPDALYERPIPERHRLIFYLGHLEAFDWNLLSPQKADLRSPQPAFDQLFAFGIDPVGGGLPTDGPQDWPSIAEVTSYNEETRRRIDGILESGQLEESGNPSDTELSTLLQVAVEHRWMHAETLAYLCHRLPYEQKVPQQQAVAAGSGAHPGVVPVPRGCATLGLAREKGFGWDNELGSHQVDVPPFLIDKFMVTNGQYREFLLAGGYDHPSLWKERDWDWIQSRQIRHPAFWQQRDEDWTWLGMFDEMELPLDWPVYVSLAEASAYARWAGKTLPTEAQWHRAAFGTASGVEREYPWGNEGKMQGRGNFDFLRWDPTPVDAFGGNVSAFGVVGMVGNGWEWTSSEFRPFPGFKPFSFYPGYSANFFDGQHFVLKGGSSRTAAPLLRRSFRNWFQPHYQYAYTGFRCVTSTGSDNQKAAL
jgi:gamma-glutamyl hercynylcysteine S-oxide synthase